MIETLLLVAVLGIAAGGAGWDIARRQIPNLLCFVLALVAASYALQSGGLSLLGSAALHAIAALLAGMALFAFGAIGGGDAKFYAAGAFAVPLSKALVMLFATVSAGLLLVIIMALGRRYVSRDNYSLSELRKLQLPYGVAIAIGLCAALLFG